MDALDHKSFLAQLSREQRRALLGQSDFKAASQTILHLGLLIVTGSYILLGLPFWQGMLLGHGILLVFLFTPLHETIHNTAFRSDPLNRLMSNFCGFLLILPPRWFRYFHFAHHRHTNDPALDPELADPKPATWTQYLLYLSGLPVWKSHLLTLLTNAIRENADAFVPRRAKMRIRREAQLYCLLYLGCLIASLLLNTTLLFWVWIFPAMIGQPFLRAYLLAEHTLCPSVANMFENSRTTFTMAMVRKLAWNMPYHAEHHAYPSVPFYNLPELHALARAHLKSTANGYTDVHRQISVRLMKIVQPDSG